MKLLIPYAITDATLTSSNAPETDHAAWSAATAYTLGQRVIRAATHRIYERLVAGTTTTAPEADPENWLDVAPTNRWAMFDGAIGTRTTLASPLTISVTLGAVIDIVLLGVTGTTVVVTRPNGTTVSASVPAAVVASEGSTVKITGIAGTAGVYQITVSGTGSVAVGNISLGTLTDVGDTHYGSGLGINDYSTKRFDAFGQPEVVRRGYSRTLSPRLSFPLASLDQVVRILAAVRSKPVVWIGADTLASTVIWGYCREWSMTVRFPRVTATLTLESLALG